MPLFQPGAEDAPKVYGVDRQDPTLPFQEKLMRKFKPQEFVTVKNISHRRIEWQYLSPDAEEESFSEDGMQKHIRRAKPELWYIEPGQTDVLVGANAYRALDVLYKQIAVDKTLARYSDPNSPQYDESRKYLPKNFNFSDGSLQDSVIESSYLGKATPVFNDYTTTQPQVTPVTPTPTSDEQIPVPASAPNGQPEPETKREWPTPKQQYAKPDKALTTNAKR